MLNILVRLTDPRNLLVIFTGLLLGAFVNAHPELAGTPIWLLMLPPVIGATISLAAEPFARS